MSTDIGYVYVDWAINGIPTEIDIIAAAAAGMISRRDEPYYEYAQKLTYDEACAFLKKIIKWGHFSVLEHIHFSFYISLSRTGSHQLVRHRVASYTQSSRRKIRETFGAVIPVEIKEEDRIEWIEDMLSSVKDYMKWLKKGYTVDTARRQLKEGLRTDLIFTVNARSLRNVFELRLDSHTDPEFRDIARAMYDLIKKAGYEFLFKDIIDKG